MTINPTEDQQTVEQVLARWALPPEFDEAGKEAMREKAKKQSPGHDAFGDMSDEWVANRVRMLVRDDIYHEAFCTAGRDRIMRLSMANELLGRFMRDIHCALSNDDIETVRDLVRQWEQS